MLAGQWSITTVCSYWKKCFLKLFGNIRMVCLVYTEQRNLFQETQSIGHWNKRSILMQPVREWYWFRDYGPFMTTNQTTAEIVLNKVRRRTMGILKTLRRERTFPTQNQFIVSREKGETSKSKRNIKCS